MLLGILSNVDDDGSENVAKKISLRSFKLNKMKEISSSYVYVLHKTRFHVVVMKWTSKKCTKKRDARAELLFWSLNLLFFQRVIVVVVVVALKQKRKEIFLLPYDCGNSYAVYI